MVMSVGWAWKNNPKPTISCQLSIQMKMTNLDIATHRRMTSDCRGQDCGWKCSLDWYVSIVWSIQQISQLFSKNVFQILPKNGTLLRQGDLSTFSQDEHSRPRNTERRGKPLAEQARIYCSSFVPCYHVWYIVTCSLKTLPMAMAELCPLGIVDEFVGVESVSVQVVLCRVTVVSDDREFGPCYYMWQNLKMTWNIYKDIHRKRRSNVLRRVRCDPVTCVCRQRDTGRTVTWTNREQFQHQLLAGRDGFY